MLGKLGIQKKIVAALFSMVFLSLALVIGASIFTSKKALNESSIEIVRKTADYYTSKTSETLNRSMYLAKALGDNLEALHRAGIKERMIYNEIVRSTLEANPSILGAWTAWEANTLDGRDQEFANTAGHDVTGRFIPYWYRSDGNTALEPLISYDQPGDGDYYQLPYTTGKAVILEPYLYPVGGVETLITSLALPIRIDGEIVGVAGVDVAMTDLQKIMNEARPFDVGYVSLLSESGILVAHAAKDSAGQNAGDYGFSVANAGSLSGKGQLLVNGVQDPLFKEDTLRLYQPLQIAFSDNVWMLAISVPEAVAFAAEKNALLVQLGILAVALVGAILVAWYIGRGISQPIVAVTESMNKLAAGNADVPLVGVERQDEIGDMSRAVRVFKENAIERVRLVSEAEAEREMQALRQSRIDEAISAFETTIESSLSAVSQSSGNMEQTAQTLSQIADDTAGQASSAATGSEEASTNVQTVASAAEELSVSIAEISRQVEETKSIVGGATEASSLTNEKIVKLDGAAQHIGEVVNLIRDIAEQTNLLALNATIEAARAGEMGKGFAVVASEVKELATQTSKATEEISNQISDIQGSSREAVEAIEVITSTMGEVNNYTSSIASAVQQQGSATAEISQNVQLAAARTLDVARSMSQVTEAASGTTDSAGNVLSASQDVSKQATELREGIDRFLVEVRSA